MQKTRVARAEVRKQSVLFLFTRCSPTQSQREAARSQRWRRGVTATAHELTHSGSARKRVMLWSYVRRRTRQPLYFAQQVVRKQPAVQVSRQAARTALGARVIRRCHHAYTWHCSVCVMSRREDMREVKDMSSAWRSAQVKTRCKILRVRSVSACCKECVMRMRISYGTRKAP